jgi:hypothetical protein
MAAPLAAPLIAPTAVAKMPSELSQRPGSPVSGSPVYKLLARETSCEFQPGREVGEIIKKLNALSIVAPLACPTAEALDQIARNLVPKQKGKYDSVLKGLVAKLTSDQKIKLQTIEPGLSECSRSRYLRHQIFQQLDIQ